MAGDNSFDCAQVVASCQRWLHLQEYQSKALMRDHNIDVQHFEVVDNHWDAKHVPERLSKTYSAHQKSGDRVTETV